MSLRLPAGRIKLFDKKLDRQLQSLRKQVSSHKITKGQAREILRQCNVNGLIHTIIKCRQDFYAICNCCSCCCVPLRLNKQYGIGNALVRKSNIVEEVKER